jgi:hypothetical protein
MIIHFTISPALLEFACHFVAAFFYLSTGHRIQENGGNDLQACSYICIAIILTVIGAHL